LAAWDNGQSGGMIMVGDMFNNALKARVDAICTDVAQLMRQSTPLRLPPAVLNPDPIPGRWRQPVRFWRCRGNWWPDDLGHAASSGAQNKMRYAWFPETRRLAIDAGDSRVRVYDTGDHRIGGFSQQQSGDQSLRFTSQHGQVNLSELREVKTDGPAASLPGAFNAGAAPAASDAGPDAGDESRTEDPSGAEPSPVEPSPAQPETQQSAGPAPSVDESDIFEKIERLAALHAKGILTDSEYQSKKAELLARI
jgi:hypothetical protein